jgi:hypothetical protein
MSGFKGFMWIRLLIGRPLVALVSFAIGVLSVSTLQYWNSFSALKLEPIPNDEYAREISVCELGEPSGKFVGKRISVNATVYHVSCLFVAFSDAICFGSHLEFRSLCSLHPRL